MRHHRRGHSRHRRSHSPCATVAKQKRHFACDSCYGQGRLWSQRILRRAIDRAEFFGRGPKPQSGFGFVQPYQVESCNEPTDCRQEPFNNHTATQCRHRSHQTDAATLRKSCIQQQQQRNQHFGQQGQPYKRALALYHCGTQLVPWSPRRFCRLEDSQGFPGRPCLYRRRQCGQHHF